MKPVTAIFLMIITIFLVSLGSYTLLLNLTTYELRKIPIEVEVNDFVGFNLNNSKLNMGTVMPGGRSKRNITLENTLSDDIKVHIEIPGNLNSWVVPVPNDFILKPRESGNVEFILTPPHYTLFGNYSDVALIYLRKA